MEQPTSTMGNPIQIHTLQIAKQQEGTPMTRIQAVKTKTKEQVKQQLQCHSHKGQKEIALQVLKEVPKDLLTPQRRKLLQRWTPVIMGNLSVIKEGPIG